MMSGVPKAVIGDGGIRYRQHLKIHEIYRIDGQTRFVGALLLLIVYARTTMSFHWGGRGSPIVKTVLRVMELQGLRLTVGIEGSFGILHYAVLAFTAAPPTTSDRQPNVEQWPLLNQELMERGFRPARNADVEDIVLKAQPADGSIQCRASTEGLISLLVDTSLVWSRQFNPEDPETALWLKTARTRGVTIISGDHLGSGETKVNRTESVEALVMAKVPTAWTR